MKFIRNVFVAIKSFTIYLRRVANTHAYTENLRGKRNVYSDSRKSVYRIHIRFYNRIVALTVNTIKTTKPKKAHRIDKHKFNDE